MQMYQKEKKNVFFKEFIIYTYLWNSMKMLSDVQNQYSAKIGNLKKQRFLKTVVMVFLKNFTTKYLNISNY